MAKRTTATAGPSTGLIVTLIFFILTTFIAGTLAYFGYSDQEKFKKDRDEAKKTATDKEKLANTRLSVLLAYKAAFGNIGTGSDTNERGAFADKLADATFYPEIENEIKTLKTALENGGFQWPTDNNNKLTADPAKSVSALFAELKNLATTAENSRKQAVDDRAADKLAYEAKEKSLNSKIAGLEVEKGKLENALKEAEKAKISEFEGLVKALAEKGQQYEALSAQANQKASDDMRLIAARDKTIQELEIKIKGYESRNPNAVDLLAKDTKKADIEKVDGEFVYLNRGSADLLRPQTTFSVLPADAVWRNSDEKTRLIKGEIEVIQILGPNSARAKILSQRNELRDPIRARDQLFNVMWTPGQRESIAFAGIIDINGDGIDDNKTFIQLVERQGVTIDQYLDLETRTVKGKGMSIRTKFLVLGPEVTLPEDYQRRKERNDPRILAMEEIMNRMNQIKVEAGKLGVQVIDYRKFLVSIGVKLPEKTNPITYDSMAFTKREDRETMQKENENNPK